MPENGAFLSVSFLFEVIWALGNMCILDDRFTYIKDVKSHFYIKNMVQSIFDLDELSIVGQWLIVVILFG